MNRRTLLRIAAVSPAIALVGCGTLTVSQLENDIQAIADGVNAVLPSIKAVTGIKQSVLDQVSGWAADIKQLAADLASHASLGTTTVTATVSTLTGDVSSIWNALHGKGLPSWAQTVLDAAISLAPTVLSLAGIALAGPPPLMSPPQARAILHAAKA